MVVENVKTKNGKDFYDFFYQKYTTSGAKYPFVISINEKPFLGGRGALVSVEIGDDKIFEFQFLIKLFIMKQIYLRYLVLAETLRKSNIDLSEIDDIGKKLLETIAIKSAQGQPLVVTQTMELSDIASPATIHRRIEILKKAGLIQVMQTEQNQKIKF